MKETRFTITGNVPSKKNQQQIIYVRRRPVIIPSNNHKRWHKQAIRQLYGIPPIQGEIAYIKLVFYPNSRRVADASNKCESAMDLIVDAGIIEDDNWFIVPEVRPKFGGVDKENPRVEITIYEKDAVNH